MVAYLVPIEKGKPIPLNKPVLFIGRHPDCDVNLGDSRKVSRKHCCIAQVNDHYVLRDLGSMNGVRLNGTRVRRQSTMAFGDELAIGDIRYILQDNDTPVRKSEQQAGQTSAEPADSPSPRRAPPPSALSQELPVAIPDIGETFDALPPAEVEDDVVPLDDGSSYDERTFNSSREFKGRDSQVEILPE